MTRWKVELEKNWSNSTEEVGKEKGRNKARVRGSKSGVKENDVVAWRSVPHTSQSWWRTRLDIGRDGPTGQQTHQFDFRAPGLYSWMGARRMF